MSKIWGYINDIKLAGVKTASSFLFFIDGFWFHFIPDRYEEREEELIINRKERLLNNE